MSEKLKILLADDSRFFRAIESKFLQKTPTEIVEAADTAQVVALVGARKPDLIYMAFSLPEEGGAACCKAIKRDPALRSVPVVIICDQGAAEQPELARQAGCDACLVKPLDRHSFLQIGRKFLDAIREHRQPSFFPVRFSSGGEEFSGKCLDISGGGMFLDTQADITAGAMVELSFKLPDGMLTQIECRAEVSWLNRKPTPMKPHYPHGLGLRFADLPAAAHRAILSFSDKKSAG